MLVAENCRSNPREYLRLHMFFRSILTLDVQNNWHLKNAAIRFVAQGCTRALHFTDSQRHSEDFKKSRQMKTSPESECLIFWGDKQKLIFKDLVDRTRFQRSIGNAFVLESLDAHGDVILFRNRLIDWWIHNLPKMVQNPLLRRGSHTRAMMILSFGICRFAFEGHYKPPV